MTAQSQPVREILTCIGIETHLTIRSILEHSYAVSEDWRAVPEKHPRRQIR
jgi:hypothetical protein